MTKSKLFQYAIIWHPYELELTCGIRSKIVVELTTILARTIEEAKLYAGTQIPKGYVDDLQQIEIIVRPF